jgi:hypothetical protein
MRSRELVAAVVLAALAAGTAGCLRNPDPRPRSMGSVESDAHGGFAVVTVPDRGVFHGELIAINHSEVWVLVGNAMLHEPLARVSGLEIHPYKVPVGRLVATGALGTLSTISHGFFLVISAPVWIVTSSVAGATYSRTARVRYEGDNWDELAKWARFPQGMPAGLTPAELLPGRQAPAGPLPPAMTPPPTTGPVPPPPTPR